MVAAVVGAALGMAVGWFMGLRTGMGRMEAALDEVVDPDSPVTSPLVPRVRTRLDEGWVPRGTERAEVTREAVARLQAFLRTRIERPLVDGLSGDDPALRAGAESAVSAVQELHFLADRRVGERSVHDLGPLLKQVLDEVEGRLDVTIRGQVPDSPIHVRVDADAVTDALALLLHNAATFGGGRPVAVTVEDAGPYARITIADDGAGFTAEALSRAYDPFYSTRPDGLGLGLPRARALIEMMSGEIHLKNGDSGGVVEVSLPLA